MDVAYLNWNEVTQNLPGLTDIAEIMDRRRALALEDIGLPDPAPRGDDDPAPRDADLVTIIDRSIQEIDTMLNFSIDKEKDKTDDIPYQDDGKTCENDSNYDDEESDTNHNNNEISDSGNNNNNNDIIGMCVCVCVSGLFLILFF